MANTEPNTGYRLVRLMGMLCMGDSDTLLPRPRSLREPARVACNTFLGLASALAPGASAGAVQCVPWTLAHAAPPSAVARERARSAQHVPYQALSRLVRCPEIPCMGL